MDSLLGLSSEEWSLFACLRKEGRKEGTPADVTSFPGVFLGSSSGLSRYPCRRRKNEQPRELLISGSQAGVMQQTGSLLKK